MIARLSAGTPGKYFESGSSIESNVIISSFRIAAAVNCFVIEPVVYTVSGVTGRCGPRRGTRTAFDQDRVAARDEDGAREPLGLAGREVGLERSGDLGIGWPRRRLPCGQRGDQSGEQDQGDRVAMSRHRPVQTPIAARWSHSRCRERPHWVDLRDRTHGHVAGVIGGSRVVGSGVMRRLPLAGVVAACVAVACCGRNAGTVPDIEGRIDAIFGDYAKADAPGCVVGVSQGGKQVFARAYGLASVESGLPLTTRSTFHIGSMSKQFTAFAAFLLAGRGHLDLSDDIRRYLPELRDYGAPIRIRDLLQHTSGFRDIGTLERLSGRQAMTMAEAVDLAARQRALNFTPGTTHAYSHMDYVLLAFVIERVTGEPLGAFLDREVFAPLGMSSTRVFDSRRLPLPGRALSHTQSEAGYRVRFPGSEVVGGSNIYTSIDDFLKWEANLHTTVVGGRAVVQQMLEQPALPSGELIPYANGLRRGEHRGLPTIVRGASGGYVSEMVRFPDQGLMVMTMCNIVPADPYALDIAVAELFLTAPMTPARTSTTTRSVPTPADELTGYVGTYRPVDVPWNLAYIEARDSSLHEVLPEGPVKMLRTPEGTYTDGGMVYTFAPPASGRPRRLTLSGDGPPPWSEVLYQVPEAEAWRPDASALREYAGTYFSEDLASQWRIDTSNGASVQRVGQPDVPLTPVMPDLFAARIEAFGAIVPFGIRFVRAADGRPAGFTVSTVPGDDQASDVRFDRR